MVRMDASTLRLHPTGDLTIYHVEEVTKKVSISLVAAEEVVVDLSDTDKIDTAGFQLLVSLHKSCVATEKKFEIVGIGESVENFMTLFGYEWNSEHKGER
jgi:anti-anti-sigma factor